MKYLKSLLFLCLLFLSYVVSAVTIAPPPGATGNKYYYVISSDPSNINCINVTLSLSNLYYLASNPSNFLSTGGNGAWTNLSSYYNDAGYTNKTVTNGLASTTYVDGVSNNLQTAIYNSTNGAPDWSSVVTNRQAGVTFDLNNTVTNVVGGMLTVLGGRVQSGTRTFASNLFSHAAGGASPSGSIIASGQASHAEGFVGQGLLIALGNGSYVGGYINGSETNLSAGLGSFAYGRNVQATGNYSVAFGNLTRAYGITSFAEGFDTTASGDSSHAEGGNTKALGQYSHSEGVSTIASGANSHAEGQQTTASGTNSHAAGQNANASNNNSYVWSDGVLYGSHGTNSYNINAYGGLWMRQYRIADIDGLLYSGGNLVLTNYTETDPEALSALSVHSTNNLAHSIMARTSVVATQVWNVAQYPLAITNNGGTYTLTITDATITNHPVTLQQVKNMESRSVTLYMHGSVTSSVWSGAYTMDNSVNFSNSIQRTVNSVTNNQYIFAFVSPPMGLTEMQQGTYQINAQVSASGASSTAKWEGYILRGGVTIYESPNAEVLSIPTSQSKTQWNIIMSSNLTGLLPTDRWMIRMKSVNGANRNISIWTEGPTPALLTGSPTSGAEVDPLSLHLTGGIMSGNVDHGNYAITNISEVIAGSGIFTNVYLSSDTRIGYQANNTMVFQYLNGGVWSNALEITR